MEAPNSVRKCYAIAALAINNGSLNGTLSVVLAQGDVSFTTAITTTVRCGFEGHGSTYANCGSTNTSPSSSISVCNENRKRPLPNSATLARTRRISPFDPMPAFTSISEDVIDGGEASFMSRKPMMAG